MYYYEKYLSFVKFIFAHFYKLKLVSKRFGFDPCHEGYKIYYKGTFS